METNKPAITGLKKRQQIQQANRVVFVWVGIAAVAVTVSVVLGQFMVKQLLFNGEIIGAEQKANETLVKNIAAYAPLKANVIKLIADPSLNRLRVAPTDNSLQVVIDAMPTVDDRISLAASLQQSIFVKSGVSVETLSFTDSSLSTEGVATVASPVATGLLEAPFIAKVSGSYDSIKKLFVDIHNSIRPISVTSIKLSGTSSNMSCEITAVAFYAAPATTALNHETKKP